MMSPRFSVITVEMWAARAAPGNQSAPRCAKRVAGPLCPLLRTFTPTRPFSRMCRRRADRRFSAILISGGYSDREVKELTVAPCGTPFVAAMTTVTGAHPPDVE